MIKIYSAIAIGLLLFTQFTPVEAEESKLDVEPYSTAQYYWWKQDATTYLWLQPNGGYIDHGPPFYAPKGQSVCFTPVSSAPTVEIDYYQYSKTGTLKVNTKPTVRHVGT